MNINRFFKEETYAEHCDVYPAFVAMTGYGFTGRLYEALLFSYSTCVVYCNGKGEVDWITLVSEHDKIGKFIINNYIKNNNYALNLYKRWLKNFDQLLIYYYKEFKVDFKQFTDQELLDWFKYFINLYKDKVSMPGFIDGYTFYADKRFDYLLKEFCRQNKLGNSATLFSILSAPVEPSFFVEEEEEIKNILNKIKKKGYKIYSLKNLIQLLIMPKLM
ncbi:MAG: hypothetical protein PHT51_02190 [Patescibacteria group bacterium]|nr:hypothetical protein [Patescibacteria group bacterium]MDD4611307.1 hypothetical protein [Patescibacteria group bacterium]